MFLLKLALLGSALGRRVCTLEEAIAKQGVSCLNRTRCSCTRIGPLEAVIAREQGCGTIPDYIGACENLTHLDLSFSNIQGTLPASLGALSRLEHVDLGYTLLTGDGQSARPLRAPPPRAPRTRARARLV